AATAATHGTVSLSGGTITYTPDADYNGPASFSYTIQDNGTTNGVSDSKQASGSVNVTVTAVNDAPVAQGGSLSTAEDTAATGTLVATDVDSPTLTYSLVSTSNAHGTVTITDVHTGAYSYSPAANYNGPASFTFKANDGFLDSNAATVSITVNAVNDAPKAQNGSLTTDEDTETKGTLSATDIDSTSPSYTLV